MAAQRYRSCPNVTLPGRTPAEKAGRHAGRFSINWSPTWAFDSVAQYNIKAGNSTRTTLGVRYSLGLPYGQSGLSARTRPGFSAD